MLKGTWSFRTRPESAKDKHLHMKRFGGWGGSMLSFCIFNCKKKKKRGFFFFFFFFFFLGGGGQLLL